MDWTKLIEFLNLGKRPSFILAGIGWVFLLIPDDMRQMLRMTELSAKISPYVGGLTFIFSTYFVLYFAYEVIERVSKLFGRKFHQHSERRRVLGWLSNLSSDEKTLLKRYIQADSKTQCFSITDGVAAGLTVKGILYQPASGAFFESVAHNIQDVVFEHLRKHPELLK